MKIIELVKELRARTHLGMSECKKALEESEGDIEKALEGLQKRGLKKIDDLVLPTEGIVQASVMTSEDHPSPYGFIVEVNCQTDFGARSELFQNFVNDLTHQPDLYGKAFDRLKLLSNQLGEKVIIRKSAFMKHMNDSIITVYNHLGGKIAVLMQSAILPGYEANADVLAMLDNIAMQIAATKPLVVDQIGLPRDLVQKKIALYEDEVKFKPEQVKAKILVGKMDKWYSEIVLLEQEAVFLGDSSVKETIQDQLNKFGPNVIKIEGFIRYERGETL